MSDFERIEERRERNEGLVFEAWREQRALDRDAYDLDDPKHPDFYERVVEAWDSREGK